MNSISHSSAFGSKAFLGFTALEICINKKDLIIDDAIKVE